MTTKKSLKGNNFLEDESEGTKISKSHVYNKQGKRLGSAISVQKGMT